MPDELTIIENVELKKVKKIRKLEIKRINRIQNRELIKFKSIGPNGHILLGSSFSHLVFFLSHLGPILWASWPLWTFHICAIFSGSDEPVK